MLAEDIRTQAESVERHLAGCAACRMVAERLHNAWTLLGTLEHREPSPRFAAGVMAKLAPTGTRARPLIAPWLRWTAAAATFAAITLVASILLDRERTNDETASGVVAELDLDLLESQEMLQNLDVIEDLDLLLLLDEG
jgi:predicted anti-sigma-YlaC factor YlaD